MAEPYCLPAGRNAVPTSKSVLSRILVRLPLEVKVMEVAPAIKLDGPSPHLMEPSGITLSTCARSTRYCRASAFSGVSKYTLLPSSAMIWDCGSLLFWRQKP